MSALGQKPTYALQQAMSALPPIATAKADTLSRAGQEADDRDRLEFARQFAVSAAMRCCAASCLSFTVIGRPPGFDWMAEPKGCNRHAVAAIGILPFVVHHAEHVRERSHTRVTRFLDDVTRNATDFTNLIPRTSGATRSGSVTSSCHFLSSAPLKLKSNENHTEE